MTRYIVEVPDHRAQAFEVHVMQGGWADSVTEVPAIAPVQMGPAGAFALTRRQRAVLQAITDLTQLRGYPPSMRELGDAVGINVSSVAYQIAVLRGHGLVEGVPGQPRSLKVVAS